MNIVIVGCGRVGAAMAETFDRAGNRVVILDLSTRAFEKLPSSFGGEAVRGDGTDEDVLRRAGAEDADLFIALTEGDNRNIMAAQLAVEALSAKMASTRISACRLRASPGCSSRPATTRVASTTGTTRRSRRSPPRPSNRQARPARCRRTD